MSFRSLDAFPQEPIIRSHFTEFVQRQVAAGENLDVGSGRLRRVATGAGSNMLLEVLYAGHPDRGFLGVHYEMLTSGLAEIHLRGYDSDDEYSLTRRYTVYSTNTKQEHLLVASEIAIARDSPTRVADRLQALAYATHRKPFDRGLVRREDTVGAGQPFKGLVSAREVAMLTLQLVNRDITRP